MDFLHVDLQMRQRIGAPPGILAWPQELQVLFCCGRVRESAANDALLDELLDGALDWGYVLERGSLLGMLPLLQAKLAPDSTPRVPAEVRALLRHHSLAAQARSLQSVGELFALMDLFAARGIPFMPFKGPVLAVQAYGAVSLRPFADLDLLVRPEDVPAACGLLEGCGYTSRYMMNAAQCANLLRFGCEHPFQRVQSLGESVSTVNPGAAVSQRRDDVDLHWNLFPPSFPIAFDGDALWNRTEVVTVARRKMTTIGTDILILYLCAHGYAHHWSRLEWICALGRLIVVRPDIHWEWIRQEARRIGAERVLELGLVLAGDWFDAPVPADLLAEARRRPAMATLIGHVAERILRDPVEPGAVAPTLNDGLFFDLDASENWRRRISYFLRRLVTPSLEDVEWVALPAQLPALYYALRPLRLSLRCLHAQPDRPGRHG